MKLADLTITDDWDSLFDELKTTSPKALTGLLGENGLPWNGQLYLSLSKDHIPVIHGFIKPTEKSEPVDVAFILHNGTLPWVRIELEEETE